jgi:hypothetical protein
MVERILRVTRVPAGSGAVFPGFMAMANAYLKDGVLGAQSLHD